MKTATWLDLFGGVRGFLFACVATLSLLFVGVQSWRLKSEKAGRVDDLVELALLRGASAENLVTITALETRNKELAEGREIDKRANERAVARIKELEAKTDAANRAAYNARQEIYRRDQNAATWAATAVPVDLYQRLLDASGEDANGD